MIRIYIGIFLLAILGTAAGGAYVYYKDTQARIATLVENNAKLEIVAKTNQETIQRMQEDTIKLQQSIGELNVQLQSAEKYKDELIQKLQKHDLSRLSLQKPGLIEKRINDGTQRIFDELENLTKPKIADTDTTAQ